MACKFDFSGWFFGKLLAARIILNVFLFNHIIQIWCRIKGIKLGKHIKFNGYPILSRAQNSTITIGDNCSFNSARKSVVLDLNRRCNLVTTREGASITIGKNSGITGGSIVAAASVVIGENVLMGAYCTIIDNDFHQSDPNKRNEYNIISKPVIIEDNVFLGFNCLVQKGVTIGKNSVIGANSVVVNNIPPNSIAMGNPCKLIMKRSWESSSPGS